MWAIDRVVERYGGLVRRSELLAYGFEPEFIDLVLHYGKKLARVRNGWYAHPAQPAALLTAWRAGGRLACVSAMEYYGAIKPRGGPVHVTVARNAARLPAVPETVLHWDDLEHLTYTIGPERRAVPLERAQSQMRRCPHWDADTL